MTPDGTRHAVPAKGAQKLEVEEQLQSKEKAEKGKALPLCGLSQRGA